MLILLIPLYLVVRLINLTAIPIFTDEAMYLRWAQIGLNEPAKYLFISLIDGKQPLFIWLNYPFLYLFGDPLISGRLISVFVGLLTMIFLYLISNLIFKNKKIAVLSSLFYIVFPFAVINDRLALYDSLLGFLFVTSIYFQIKLAKRISIKTAVILGIVMGLGFLTKSSASFFLLFAPMPFIFLKEKNKKTIFSWTGHLILAFLISGIISSILFLSPLHGMVKMKNEVFLLTPAQFLSNPFFAFWGNLKGLVSYFPPYFSWAWVILIILAVINSMIKIIFKNNGAMKQWSNHFSVIYLFLLFFIPFISLAFFAKIIYPRFIFFMTIPLLIILACQTNWFLEKAKNYILQITIILLIIIFPFYNSFLIITKPVDAYLPEADSEQLLNNWPAGWGVKEVVDYVKSKLTTTPIFIGTEGTQGLFPYSLEIYFQGHANIQVKGYWPVDDIPAEVRKMASSKETYFIYKDTLNPKPQKNVQEIFRVRRGIGENWLILFKVLSIYQ